MLEWIGLPQAAVWWIVIASASTFVLTLIAVPLLIIRILVDYFAHPDRPDPQHPRGYLWFRMVMLIIKNALGIGFLFLGALMLVLPGQGILTILIGIMLLDFPGKFRLQRWVVSRKGVLDSINWIRKRRGRDPLILGS
ncbi:hypothetical protein ACFLSZ_02340 [Candidatus Bipolaricaulota bacterium]